MPEPFVFHFTPDERGFPELMTVADIQATCGLCKHEEIQRFYRAFPFHSMTIERLDALSAEVRGWTDYACANCGTEVGPDDARATTFVWAFPDDSGLIRIFRDDQTRYQLVPRRRLDPQELPGFEPVDGDGPEVDELDDAAIERELARPFSLKLAIRDFLLEKLRDDSPGWAPLGRSMWILDGVALDEIDDPDLRDAAERGALTTFELADSIPTGLTTVPDPEGLPGRLETWLGARLMALVDSWDDVVIAVDQEPIRELLERTLTVGRLDFEADDHAVGTITTPNGREVPHTIEYAVVARRAAYTGISPGEAAQLTVEEIVAPLLNLNRKRTR